MPIFARDVLEIGASGQGVLLSASGIGALAATVWLSSGRLSVPRGPLLIVGATIAGLSIAAFGLTSKFVGSYPLAIALMVVVGIFTSMYLISITSSLQIMVPNNLRGRVMGIYSLTWGLIYLGGMQAGAIANFIGAPYTMAIGGLAVSAFALGPALFNHRIRHLGALVRQAEGTPPADA